MSSFPLLLPFLFFILMVPAQAKNNPNLKHAPPPQTHPSHIVNISNVLNFGAKGDGKTDDTKAFLKAWNDACKKENPTVLVPANHIFLVGPVEFSGKSCPENFFFQLKGNITASTNPDSWGKQPLQWLNFANTQGLTIQGGGSIHGQGKFWWNGKMPGTPTALRVADSHELTVTDISIFDSARAHLKLDSCNGVRVESISINSAAASPNTDGIHLQNTVNAEIKHSKIDSGDDNISIQTGCEGITIESVSCGQGHGISIGGLGKGGTTATVSGVTVTDCTFYNTVNGVRIKTWKGGSGQVQNVNFNNIQVVEVENAIVIDQYYTDNGDSKERTDVDGVAISDVTFVNIHGSYTHTPIFIACSTTHPCKNITLENIQLKPSPNSKPQSSTCYKASVIKENVTPPLNCSIK